MQVFEGAEAKEKGNEGKSRCFGFVNFEEHESAVKAIETLNGKVSVWPGFDSLLCVFAVMFVQFVLRIKPISRTKYFDSLPNGILRRVCDGQHNGLGGPSHCVSTGNTDGGKLYFVLLRGC